VTIAKGFARIHWKNLVNFGVLPLTFTNESDYHSLEQGDTLALLRVPEALQGVDTSCGWRMTPRAPS
jgi:aconitate hydratase